MLIAVRKRNAEFDEMCDLKTLKQWARTGEIHPDDLIKEAGEWKPAREISVLKGFFATAAWDVAEEVLWKPQVTQQQDQSAVKEAPKNIDKPNVEMPSPAQRILSIEAKLTATSKTKQTEEIPVVSDRSDQGAESAGLNYDEVEREYLRSKPQTSPEKSNPMQTFDNSDGDSSLSQSARGAFVEGTINDEAVRWNPEMDIKDQLGILVDEMPPKSNFSWFRLTILVIPGAFILFIIRAFVISEAQTVFPKSSTVDVVVDSDDLREGNAPMPTNTQSDTLYALEASLKSKLRQNTQLVTPEQSLSDALRIDLEYVGLDIVRLDARVLKWKGRLLNQPKSASITIVIDSNGEVETEFILASLVVAKYSVRYYLDMPRFTIVIQAGDVALSKTISTEKAQFLYLQPGSLKDFIRALSDTP